MFAVFSDHPFISPMHGHHWSFHSIFKFLPFLIPTFDILFDFYIHSRHADAFTEFSTISRFPSSPSCSRSPLSNVDCWKWPWLILSVTLCFIGRTTAVLLNAMLCYVCSMPFPCLCFNMPAVDISLTFDWSKPLVIYYIRCLFSLDSIFILSRYDLGNLTSSDSTYRWWHFP